jgi:hypothetical protein
LPDFPCSRCVEARQSPADEGTLFRFAGRQTPIVERHSPGAALVLFVDSRTVGIFLQPPRLPLGPPRSLRTAVLTIWDALQGNGQPIAPYRLVEISQPTAVISRRLLRSCHLLLDLGYARMTYRRQNRPEYADFLRFAITTNTLREIFSKFLADIRPRIML